MGAEILNCHGIAESTPLSIYIIFESMRNLAEYGDECDIDTDGIREARRAYRAALVAWRVGKIPELRFWPVYDRLKALVDESADVHADSNGEKGIGFHGPPSFESG
jgi:hypothetical protein